MNPDLSADIEALKRQFPNTRELYREVCALLFFRHGITPTASRLYQLVKRGSMSTPTDVLRQFWVDLRENARVRLDRSDLPTELRELGGEWLSRVWSLAQQSAQAELAPMRDQHGEQVRQAGAEVQAVRAELERLRERLRQAQADLEAAGAREADAARELATNQGRIASMTEMLRETAQEMQRVRQELAWVARDAARATGEANALRVQMELASRRPRRAPASAPSAARRDSQEALALDPVAFAPASDQPSLIVDQPPEDVRHP